MNDLQGFWAPLFGFFGVIVTVVVPLVWANRRAENRLRTEIQQNAGLTQATIGNGVKTILQEIQQDMQLTVLPTLAMLKEWRDGYKKTQWADAKAIEDWLQENETRLRELGMDLSEARRALTAHIEQQIIQFKTVEDHIAATNQRLKEHDEWERSVKYEETPQD